MAFDPAAWQRERRKKRRDAGLCISCDLPRLPTGPYCERHKRENCESVKRTYAKRRAIGCCPTCKRPLEKTK